jgi:hypothetical protein
MGMRCKSRNGKSPSNAAERSEGRRDGVGGGEIDQLLKTGKEGKDIRERKTIKLRNRGNEDGWE